MGYIIKLIKLLSTVETNYVFLQDKVKTSDWE